VETFLGSHSREKCVYKGKCVSTSIKGKHNTWLARRLTTYKYENARLDKNLHQFFVFILVHRNNSTLHLYRPSYSISAIKIEIVPFCQVIFKSKDPSENIRGFFFIDYLAWCILLDSVIKTPTKDRKSFYVELWFSPRCCHRHLGPNLYTFTAISSTFYGDFMTYHRHFTAKKHRPRWFCAKNLCAYCIIIKVWWLLMKGECNRYDPLLKFIETVVVV